METKNQKLLKEAEKAADKLAEKYYHQPLKDTAIHEGFMAGIKWYKEHIWHPFDEEPKATPCDEYGCAHDDDVIELLVVTKDDEAKLMYSTHEEECEGDDEGYWLFHDEDDKPLTKEDLERISRITKLMYQVEDTSYCKMLEQK